MRLCTLSPALCHLFEVLEVLRDALKSRHSQEHQTFPLLAILNLHLKLEALKFLVMLGGLVQQYEERVLLLASEGFALSRTSPHRFPQIDIGSIIFAQVILSLKEATWQSVHLGLSLFDLRAQPSLLEQWLWVECCQRSLDFLDLGWRLYGLLFTLPWLGDHTPVLRGEHLSDEEATSPHLAWRVGLYTSCVVILIGYLKLCTINGSSFMANDSILRTIVIAVFL